MCFGKNATMTTENGDTKPATIKIFRLRAGPIIIVLAIVIIIIIIIITIHHQTTSSDNINIINISSYQM